MSFFPRKISFFCRPCLFGAVFCHILRSDFCWDSGVFSGRPPSPLSSPAFCPLSLSVFLSLSSMQALRLDNAHSSLPLPCPSTSSAVGLVSLVFGHVISLCRGRVGSATGAFKGSVSGSSVSQSVKCGFSYCSSHAMPFWEWKSRIRILTGP